MGWLQLIPSMPDSQTPFDEIFYAVERLTTISNRLELLVPPIRKQKFDLFPLAEAVVIYFEKRIGSDKDRVKFLVDVGIDDALKGQTELIHWALESLVKNALDALPEMKGEIRIKLTTSEEYATLSVLDNGIGLEAADYSKLFEPGYSTRKKGRGIGLALVKHIAVTLHGGTVELCSAEAPYKTAAIMKIPQK